MSGALVDLVAIGVQDTYLTGDPKMTYFRQNYKRHTNFAMEPVRQVIEGDAAIGGWSQVTITRNGDLLTDVFFLSDSTGNTPIVAPFEEVQLYIGGQHIDTITREENVAMTEQFRLNNSSTNLAPTTVNGTSGSHSLQFFFGRGYSCALPLCALQYHDVTLRIKWPSVLVGTSYNLYADYVQLDTAERNAFASNSLTMLIEQHQRTPLTIPLDGVENYSDLQFSHPVKAVYGTSAEAVSAAVVLPLDSFMKLSFNGKTRTPSLPTENYYSDHQGGKHTEHGIAANALFPMYSFALYANRNTPSGSCNFSRIDNARLTVNSNATGAAQGNFYALNWNFLKIEDGMGGLLFAN